jgi:hypothetical protein
VAERLLTHISEEDIMIGRFATAITAATLVFAGGTMNTKTYTGHLGEICVDASQCEPGICNTPECANTFGTGYVLTGFQCQAPGITDVCVCTCSND